jgi:RNA polymerase sigma-70 factor (ECF subfamily)
MEPGAERSLIMKSISGNQQAFRLLVEAHLEFAYSLTYRFIREPMESEDIVQEAFIKVWKNLNRYDTSYRFKTWLGKIVTNLCLDNLKSGRRRNLVPLEPTVREPSYQHQDLESHELTEIVYRLAETLTEKQRAVFILRDLEMFSPDEVCTMLNMPPGNMKSNLYYARLKIREGLEVYYREKRSTEKTT